ncbi:MAG: ribosome small subunit-dependent GTPase A [Planctomycetota bacterium]
MTVGLVLSIDAKCAHVEVDGAVHRLPLRGRLFEGASREKRPLAPGDRVDVTLAADAEGSAIDAVRPRRNRLARRAAGEEDREQVIAANVDLVLVVMPVREPPFDPLLVDRILAACERDRLTAVVVLTKLDRDKKGEAAAWLQIYRDLGYQAYTTSTAPGHITSDSLDALRTHIHAGTTVLCGPSGAGKSTLVNTLVPGTDLRVGALGKLRQGQHTTTRAELVPLPGGGHVIDTPGVRAFALWGVNTQEIAFYFRDVAACAGGCAYRNCSHRDEPDCAVRGHVHQSRLRSYHLLFEEVVRHEARG